MLCIIQNVDEFAKAFMKRVCEEKIKIYDCLDLIAIQVFRKGVLKCSNLFTKLIMMVSMTKQEAYEEAQNFVNLER